MTAAQNKGRYRTCFPPVRRPNSLVCLRGLFSHGKEFVRVCELLREIDYGGLSFKQVQ